MFASLPSLWPNSRATLASGIPGLRQHQCSGPGWLCLLTALIKKTRSGQDSWEWVVKVLAISHGQVVEVFSEVMLFEQRPE